MAVFCWMALERLRLKIKTLSTLSVEGKGKVSRSVAAAATFRLAPAKVGHDDPSQFMVAATSLARARALVRLTITAWPISSMDLWWCNSGN
jgi:hypothetical protein